MSKSDKVIAEKAIGYSAKGEPFMISEKQGLLYAVGIGFSLGSDCAMQIRLRRRTSSTPTSSTKVFLLSPR
jgi:hypothetical protein